MRLNHFSYTLFAVMLFCMLIIACDSDDLTDPEKMDVLDKRLSGGKTTIFDATSHAFSTPAPNLSADGLTKHLDGDLEFEAVFVTVSGGGQSGARSGLQQYLVYQLSCTRWTGTRTGIW